ncbi:MAG: FAD-dependent oxidoreductase [Parvibaculum sp.]|nr:FAD-dependent oxidoreductase [Parvibaculum sp.]
MLIDAHQLDAGSELAADICIIGAGAAGLILAHELARAGRDILVLESGGPESTAQTAALMTGRAVTRPPFQLAGARRQLGGSFRDWGANCSLIDPADLAAPAEAGGPCWPDALAQLNGLAARAADYLCGFGRFSDYSLADTAGLRPAPPAGAGGGTALCEKLYLRGAPQAAAQLAVGLARADSPVRLVLHATVLELAIADGMATGLSFATLAGARFTVRARTFIVAAGTENAPLLLRSFGPDSAAARRRLPALGRFLHTHLLSLHGFLLPGAQRKLLHRYLLPVTRDGIGESPRSHFFGLTLPAAGDAPAGGPGSCLFLDPVIHDAPLLARATIARAGRWRRIPRHHNRRFLAAASRVGWSCSPVIYGLRHFMEQPPRWEAEVSLGAAAGPLGLPAAQFSWQIGQAEKMAMIRSCERLAALLPESGMGRIVDHETIADPASVDFGRNAHPMGGTVIGTEPKRSVVDENLRVHGIGNLHVCGGSAIPRSGTAMTTSLIAQLALHLADHLKTGETPR